MVSYGDSSFLISIYLSDAHTERAQSYLRRNPYPIYLTPFAKSETQHALRLLAFRGIISESALTQGLLTFRSDQEEGLYEMVLPAEESLFARAEQLSHRYASILGVRYLDLLHVASATIIRSSRFLTFDARQAKLAKEVGLSVKPSS